MKKSNKFSNMFTRSDNPIQRSKTSYPESMVVLDPTCTIEQILNRAQYGMPIPQRDVSGDLTADELNILGIDGNSLATMTRMQLVDLKIRAQMRMNAIEARRRKLEESKSKEAMKKSLLAEMSETHNEQEM